jgi:hypothetical protein
MRHKLFMAAALAATLCLAVFAGQQGQHPGKGHGHDTHAGGVNKRGDRVMGFDHTKTKHRFLLNPDGGAIEVTASEANDRESRDQIRSTSSTSRGCSPRGTSRPRC